MYLYAMTCQHCCGAESIFDQKSAVRDRKRYERKGPNKTTRLLLSALKKNELSELSVLDIGGGVGVIQHELLKNGVIKATNVDASTAYQNTAREISVENGTDNLMHFMHGDFTDLEQDISIHDIVTLERVVCCYPHVDELLDTSLNKAAKYYGIVHPRSNIFFKALNKCADLYLWMKGNPFRTFMHSEKMMHGIIEEHGFKKIYSGNSTIWRVSLFKK